MNDPVQWIAEDGFQTITGKDCSITLEPRPRYCDRGQYLAKLHIDPRSRLLLDIDEQDGWPRYYFDEDRAKLEIEAWLRKRGQFVENQTKEKS